MIDCHCHLADEDFNKDIGEVISRAKENGVVGAVVVAEFESDFDRVMELASIYKDFVYPCLGIHPVQKDGVSAKTEVHLNSRVEDRIRGAANSIFGIGEVGLDFTPRYIKDNIKDKEEQREVLRRQIELSKALNLPLNVHSRSAGKPVIEFLKENGAERCLLHAFSGNLKSVKLGLEAGFYFSVPPSFTITEGKVPFVDLIPMGRLCLESDSPVLGPTRDERNEPKNIRLSAEFIAKVKKLPVEEVIKITTQNARHLFKLIK